MSLDFTKPPFDHPNFGFQFDQHADGSRTPWLPRVFRSTVDGTLAIEAPHRRRQFAIRYVGPVARCLAHFENSYLSEEFVRDNAALDFVELMPECDRPHEIEGGELCG